MAKGPRPAYIPKTDPRMPDHWGMAITYESGRVGRYEVVGQTFFPDRVEFVTSDNHLHIEYLSKIEGIDFDDKYTLMCELKREKEQKNKAE